MTESIDLRTFVAESPLYSRLELPVAYAPRPVPASTAEQVLKESKERPPLAISLLVPKFSVDALCISCKGPSIFTPVVPVKTEEDMQKFLATGGVLHHVLRFSCSRDASHELIVVLRVIAYRIDPRVEAHHLRVFILKIGMWPSLADLQKPVNDRYAKVIGASAVAELNRGIGLAAHGVGIGAFVYLRRIFEDVIEEVARAAIGAGEVKEDDYQRSRMDEKIGLLVSRLPPFVVENKNWYGIVSKGIHDLTEAECLKYFPIVRSGLEIVLDQKLEALERKQKEEAARRAIQTITAEFNERPQR